MTSAEKLEVARALARLGVDVIEAGFPAASPGRPRGRARHRRAVGVAVEERPPIVCGLARASRARHRQGAGRRVRRRRAPAHPHLPGDLRAPHEAQAPDDAARRCSRASREMVAYAREPRATTWSSAPRTRGGATRSSSTRCSRGPSARGRHDAEHPRHRGLHHARRSSGRSSAASARTCPASTASILSVHCHDDLGLATANTLAGLRAGARQAEVTINGIGERAGNTLARGGRDGARTRAPALGLTHRHRHARSSSASSRLVSTVTGIVVPPNKAIVGANAFAHESGIHQDGMLKHEADLRDHAPGDASASAQTRLVLGKHSGRRGARGAPRGAGLRLRRAALDRVFARFKALADRRKQVADADLEALVHDEAPAARRALRARRAARRLRHGRHAHRDRAHAGPRRQGARARRGRHRPGRRRVQGHRRRRARRRRAPRVLGARRHRGHRRPRRGDRARRARAGRTIHGSGADTDILVASAKAYLRALIARLRLAFLAPRRLRTRAARREPQLKEADANPVREDLGRARGGARGRARRRSSTSICTSSTR